MFAWPTKTWCLIYLFVVAFLLRLIFIPSRGFEADIAFWKSWGLAARDFGVVEGLRRANNNYPTPFTYTLGTMTTIYSLFANPHNFNEYWQSANLIYLTVSKAFPIAADFGIAILIIWIANYLQLAITPLGLLLSALYLLNPVSIMDGAWWGQVDSLGVFIFLLSIIFVLRKQPLLAGFVFMVSMMTKLQNMIYSPLFFLFIWQQLGFTGLIKSLGGATLGMIGLNAEFLWQKEAGRIITSLTENYDYFPWMSLNAYNLWWIAAGGAGMQMTDKISILGITNAKSIGLVLFSSAYLFAVLNVFIRPGLAVLQDQALRNQKLFESLVVINAAFFLLMTQSHDRYLFPTFVFLLILATFTKTNFKLFIIYLALSVLYFYNLHTALVVNYPHNGLPFLSDFTQPVFTIPVSLFFLLAFGGFIVWVARKQHWLVWSLPLIFIVGSIISKQLPLYKKQPIKLSTLTPIITTQGYGSRMRNMPVNTSIGGPNSWTWLSDQYAFFRYGIGTHSVSRHVYDINRQFTKFTTNFGIDTEAAPDGTANFEIWADGRKLFASPKMGRYDLPGFGAVDIKGVKLLELVTTDAGDGIKDDHVDWLNPLLYP